MKIHWKLFLITALSFLSVVAIGQRGPGGVSVESPTLTSCGGAAESTCGVWLDASTLTSLADGAEVLNWKDVSYSADCDDGSVPPSPLVFPPIFRNDPAFTINGLPTITFEDNRYFVLQSSDDLNTTTVTYDKMVFLAFRTSEEVIAKQTIYEEGGNVRGFNIMIHDGLLIIGSYDKQSSDSDGTPSWGYTYVSQAIQPNTTYILAAQFKAETAGILGNNGDFFLRGWLNGIDFGGASQLQPGGNFNSFTGIAEMGTLYDHPNPCGLGAVNDDTVDREQVVNGNPSTAGTWAFKGRLAEMCYYKDEISESQRLIVQNYLAAKYLAVLNFEDYYDHEFTHGHDVIGLAQRFNSSDLHNLSQGRNPFRISTEDPVSGSANQFYFTGHNGLSMAWDTTSVPNNSSNIWRLNRVWRADRTGFNYAITHEIDEDSLPPPPATFNSSNAKLVLLVDETSTSIPDFTLSTTVVREIAAIGTAPYEYEIEYNVPDDAFYTLAWLKPEVNFVLETDVGLESNPPSDFEVVNIELTLNYTPLPGTGAYDVRFTLAPGTATIGPGPAGGDDIYYNDTTSSLTEDTVSFNGFLSFTFLQLRIINDIIAEETPSSEVVTIQIIGTIPPLGEPPLLIGAKNELEYTIFDDDPDPKLSFTSWATNIQVNESAGTIDVDIIRDGNTTDVITCDVLVRSDGTDALSSASGPDPQDYDPTFSAALSFPAGPPSVQTVTIPILNDNVDEPTEILQLTLANLGGGAVGPASPFPSTIRQNIEILDDDIPVATFAAPAQSGFETIGSPSLLVQLDPISSRPVEVDFTMTPGTATFGQDYTGAEVGTIIFPPFTTDAFVGPFFVNPNLPNPEGAETVIFDLTGTTPNGESTLIQPDQLVYTILDYAPFEWVGAGGVGKNTDNIVWIDATREPLGAVGNISNRAPYSISMVDQNGEAVNTINSINGQNALDFNGSSTPGSAHFYEIQNNLKINISGSVDKLAYFFVFSPDAVPTDTTTGNPTTAHSRLLYEQGGGSRGTSIYLYEGRLYFHAWNNVDDDGAFSAGPPVVGNQAPWGNNGTPANSVYAESSQTISAGQNYVVSCIYDNLSDEPLMVYVNGEKGVLSDTAQVFNEFGVGRLWGHSGRIGLGAVNDNTRFHFTNRTSGEGRCAFDGKLAEFISYHEPELSESRRIIIENYLSGKYNIPLSGSATPQIWDTTDPEQDLFSNQIAGLGMATDSSAHTDAAGPAAIFRVNAPLFNSTNSFMMWGHNGEELTNTWPYSSGSNPYSALPGDILERSGQVWKVYETGDVTSATIQINFSASDSANLISQDFNLLKLLTHTNTGFPQDFSNATIYDLAPSGLPGGNIAKFDNIPITDGMYVTLGNTSSYFATPLPIELISFNARLAGTYVDLTWSTASEINNDYFVVERAAEDLRWEPVLEISAAGNSNRLINYRDKDREPLKGVSYYRLKQVDFDGGFSYSEPVSIFNQSIADGDDVFMYPNPSTMGSVFLRLPSVARDFETTIRLFDTSGKPLRSARFDTESNIFEFRYGELSPGIYLIQIDSEAINETKKLVVE